MADLGPVPVGDLEIADRIAKAVRRGRAADRHPTLDQLLAAFGEQEPTAEARRRAARALALAGVATAPDLLEAAPGQRVTLEVRRPRKRHVLLIGIAALALLLGAVAALASTLDTSSTETGTDLPAGTSATTQTAAPQPQTQTQTTTQDTTTQQTTSTPKQPTTAQKRAAARRAAARRARQKRERRAAARARARRRVTVRLVASQPTFLCVDGDGQRLFNGTLSGSRTFRAREVRMNVGLGPSTRVTANGKAVPLTASPTGVSITPRGQTSLPLGQRPCA